MLLVSWPTIMLRNFDKSFSSFGIVIVGLRPSFRSEALPYVGTELEGLTFSFGSKRLPSFGIEINLIRPSGSGVLHM